jgi:hypothetical protein
MGYEFRISSKPPISDLRDVVSQILVSGEQIMESSILSASHQKLGISTELTQSTHWPQCCDFAVEESGTVYALAHTAIGYEIILRFADRLRSLGYVVAIDDDI